MPQSACCCPSLADVRSRLASTRRGLTTLIRMATPDPALDRLVNQVLLPGFNGTDVPDWLSTAIDRGLGGVLYFGHNISDPARTKALSDAFHDLRDDLIVAVDEEGGDVTRLEVGAGSSTPGNAALGAVDDVDLTRDVALALAGLQRRSGIDVDFAPSVDVNSNPGNPVIGVRSFGADAELVARHGAAFVEGLQAGGIAACAKHFPGHGDTDVDSHLALPVLDSSVHELRERELVPFAAAVKAGVKSIMVAHVCVPELGRPPATLNPDIIALARRDLGFDGLLITDALDMAGASRGIGLGGAAARALAAGTDLLCIGNPDGRDDEGDYRAAQNGVLEALRSGELAVSRVEEAGARISALNSWIAGTQDGELIDLGAIGASAAHRAVRIIGDVRLAGPPYIADLRNAVNIAAGVNARHIQCTLIAAVPGTVAVDSADVADILAGSAGFPLVVVVRGPHRDTDEADRLRALQAVRPDLVAVHVGWPHEPENLGPRVVVAYGSGKAVAGAVAAVLVPISD